MNTFRKLVILLFIALSCGVVSAQQDTLRVRVMTYNLRFGELSSLEDLAYHMLLLADRPECGVFHATCEGVCTWYEFAAEIACLSGIAAQISPCTTEEYPTPVKRPAYSVLENARLKALGLNFFRSWRQALSAYFAEN